MSVDVAPAVPTELAQLRGQIDTLDAELLDTLARRFAVTDQVGQLKARQGLASVDPQREQQKLQHLRRLASEKGLNDEFIQQLFQHIFNEVVKNHRSYLGK